MFKKSKKFAFTLADVLMALMIIGVIASITIPVTMAHVRRTEIENRLEQTYSILNNALTRSVADNGPIDTWEEMKMTESSQGVSFFQTYLAPHLVFARELGKYTFEEMGYTSDIKKPNGDSVFSSPVTGTGKKITMLALNNGTSISNFGSWLFTMKDGTEQYYAVNYLIDVNGPKGPNVMGRDAFFFKLVLIGDDKRFKLAGDTKEKIYYADNRTEIIKTTREEIMEDCKTEGDYCGALIQQNGWKVPKDYPLRI